METPPIKLMHSANMLNITVSITTVLLGFVQEYINFGLEVTPCKNTPFVCVFINVRIKKNLQIIFDNKFSVGTFIVNIE